MQISKKEKLILQEIQFFLILCRTTDATHTHASITDKPQPRAALGACVPPNRPGQLDPAVGSPPISSAGAVGRPSHGHCTAFSAAPLRRAGGPGSGRRLPGERGTGVWPGRGTHHRDEMARHEGGLKRGCMHAGACGVWCASHRTGG